MGVKQKGIEFAGQFRYRRTVAYIDAGEDLRYTTYGIVAEDIKQNVVASFQDVSTDCAMVDHIVTLCNENGLDVLHLEDVILDAIE